MRADASPAGLYAIAEEPSADERPAIPNAIPLGVSKSFAAVVASCAVAAAGANVPTNRRSRPSPLAVFFRKNTFMSSPLYAMPRRSCLTLAVRLGAANFQTDYGPTNHP